MKQPSGGNAAFKTTVGGQALMEGVMMRGPHKIAYAVRGPEGKIVTEVEPVKKYAWQKIPFVRGVGGFIESMVTGYRYLMKSADIAMTEEEKAEEKPSRFELWMEKHLGEKGFQVLMTVSSVLGAALAIVLFMVVPTFLVGLLSKAVELGSWKTLLEGILKIALLVGYMAAISFVPDIARMFRYHGAEHKTIACYVHDLELTVENVRRCSRLHPRCGTSFILIILVVSVLLFSVIPWSSLSLRIVYKILLLPVVMGVSYEILKICGRYDNIVTRAISAPGLWLQRITTKEPDDGMIECAIAAVKPVLPEDRREGEW